MTPQWGCPVTLWHSSVNPSNGFVLTCAGVGFGDGKRAHDSRSADNLFLIIHPWLALQVSHTTYYPQTQNISSHSRTDSIQLWLIRLDASGHPVNCRLMWPNPAACFLGEMTTSWVGLPESSYLCCCHHVVGGGGREGAQLGVHGGWAKIPGESLRQSRLQKVGQ